MNRKTLIVALVALSTNCFVSNTAQAQHTFSQDSDVVNPSAKNTIYRMWKSNEYRFGNGPSSIYFNDGYFHGYLQKVSFQDWGIGWSVYEGWIYPVDRPTFMPTKNFSTQ